MRQIDRLLVATKNQGKVTEFRELLCAPKVSVEDLCDGRGSPHVDEIGLSFLENAQLKARAYASYFKVWSLADDSGLAVDALGGKPGIHSARWAEMNDAGKGDADNNALLLKQLDAVPDEKRTGRFLCALALADEEGRIVLTCQGSVEGKILREPRGTNGFGYDPLFFFEQLGKTTAELSSDEKHAISHRGQAMRRMVELMRDVKLID